MVDAKVVEVNSRHISVVARSGVEHVIATDAADTHVTHKGKRVDMKRLKVGDVVTVDLDTANPLKFARRIVIGEQGGSMVASAKD
jgi:ribulose-5-phosphate 4-epimerase/fuculose-1-phosphate aldolase